MGVCYLVPLLSCQFFNLTEIIQGEGRTQGSLLRIKGGSDAALSAAGS